MAIRAESFESPSAGGRADDLKAAADALWARYWESQSRDDRNQLVVFYAPLVTIVARRFARRAHSADAVEELCSFGRFGLIDAVERWDASAGFQFATYATKRIQGAIIDELRREDFLPKRLRARVQVFHTVRDDLESTLRRSPSIQEIAHELGVDVPTAIELQGEAVSLTHLAPLNDSGDSADGRVLGAATAGPSPGDWVESEAMSSAVKAALRRLTERQRQVLVLYFLEGLAKNEVADLLGIGRPRVTQLVQQGLHNLRIELGQDNIAGIDDLMPDSSVR
jgi:RNA polymerase sigma factor FliA